jgi:hypothetical protein
MRAPGGQQRSPTLHVKTRAFHTPGFFSRIIATQTTVRRQKSLGMKLGWPINDRNRRSTIDRESESLDTQA